MPQCSQCVFETRRRSTQVARHGLFRNGSSAHRCEGRNECDLDCPDEKSLLLQHLLALGDLLWSIHAREVYVIRLHAVKLSGECPVYRLVTLNSLYGRLIACGRKPYALRAILAVLCRGFRDRYSLCCVQRGLGAAHAGSCSTQRAAWFGARHYRQDGTVHCHSHPVRQEKTASSACFQKLRTTNVCCAQSHVQTLCILLQGCGWSAQLLPAVCLGRSTTCT